MANISEFEAVVQEEDSFKGISILALVVILFSKAEQIVQLL